MDVLTSILYGLASPEFRWIFLFLFIFLYFVGRFGVAEGRGRLLWHPSLLPPFVGRVRAFFILPPTFFLFFLSDPLHYLPLKRTFILESFELVDQLEIVFLFSSSRSHVASSIWWLCHNTLTKPIFLLRKTFTSRARILIGFSL